jgi:hypothetical protein
LGYLEATARATTAKSRSLRDDNKRSNEYNKGNNNSKCNSNYIERLAFGREVTPSA